MQNSIWSVPQNQNKGRKKEKTTDFSNKLKQLFTSNSPKKTVYNHHYQPNVLYPTFQPNQAHHESYPINSVLHAPPLQPQVNAPVFNFQNPENKKASVKNMSAVMGILFPILLAVLGIPFYIMVLLKIIHFVH